jgi:hypothetical protein
MTTATINIITIIIIIIIILIVPFSDPCATDPGAAVVHEGPRSRENRVHASESLFLTQSVALGLVSLSLPILLFFWLFLT